MFQNHACIKRRNALKDWCDFDMQVALNHTFRLQTIKGLAGSRHVSHNRPNRQKTGVNARRGRKPSLVWGGGHLSNGGGSGGGDSNNTRAGSGDDNGHSRPSEKAQAVLIQLLYAFVAWMVSVCYANQLDRSCYPCMLR